MLGSCLGCVYPHLVHLLWVFSVSWQMDVAFDEAAVIVVRLVHPFCIMF